MRGLADLFSALGFAGPGALGSVLAVLVLLNAAIAVGAPPAMDAGETPPAARDRATAET